MPPAPIARRIKFKVLALDIDGTLLDLDGVLRPETAEAVARASRAGIRPVLCTGRRYRRALPVAADLGIGAPLICNSGTLVKNPAEHQTLWRADFDPPLAALVLDLFQSLGQPAVSFTDRPSDGFDFQVARYPTGNPLFDEFVTKNLIHADVDPSWPDRLADHQHFHFCAIGDRPAMLAFEAAVQAALPGKVHTFVLKSPNYAGTICEVIRSDAGKWAAILHLAELWGVEAAEVCAIGDDMNDLPMIQGAGLGIAMTHAPQAVREVADLVSGDHSQGGIASIIEDTLLF